MARVATVVLAAVILLSTSVIAGCGQSESSGDGEFGRFDAGRAWELLEAQVEIGQRPAGSRQLRELAEDLREMLPNGEFEAIPGEPRLRNVVGTLPGVTPGIVVGAHYDTLVKPKGAVGANNGAAGTAAVVEIARALAEMPVPEQSREIRFVLFDGEQLSDGLPSESTDFYWEGLRGSRAYVDAQPGRTKQMILLDYVATKDLRLTRESTSSQQLWGRLLNASAKVGKRSSFSDEVGPGVIDDHFPFLSVEAEAINLIDSDYPGHTRADTVDKLSPDSLDAVGESVVQLTTELRQE